MVFGTSTRFVTVPGVTYSAPGKLKKAVEARAVEIREIVVHESGVRGACMGLFRDCATVPLFCPLASDSIPLPVRHC
jgi:hypothetical protein